MSLYLVVVMMMMSSGVGFGSGRAARPRGGRVVLAGLYLYYSWLFDLFLYSCLLGLQSI
ncbi:hypothetical protein DFH27DRAFT_571580 [Peziza echinospora]|nr:hypothetical protein DFH27DRAFT_571580 [Peziza echinospora]